MADWRNYLEGDYDGRNIIEQESQVIEDVFTAEEVAAEVQKMYQEYMEQEEKKKYLIDGAVLVCNKATLDNFELMDGTEIPLAGLKYKAQRDRDERQETVLHVRRDYSNMSVGISRNATVLDCKKGELAELDAKKKETGEVSFMANVYPFRCNCMEKADRVEEQEIIKAHLGECKTNGVCQYLMRLNDKWENWPGETGKFHEKRAVRVLEETEGGEKKVAFINADCITMTSMLFCKHGGLITPVWSGQTLVTDNTGQRVLCGEDLDDDARWLIAIMGESVTEPGRIAVFYEVLNRCEQWGKTIEEAVSEKDAYRAFDRALHEKNPENYTKDENDAFNTAYAVLNRMVPNPIEDCCYYFGKIDGYDLWAESSKSPYVFVIGDNDAYKNVFYREFETVHNKLKDKTADAKVIYDHIKQKWEYGEGKVEW